MGILSAPSLPPLHSHPVNMNESPIIFSPLQQALEQQAVENISPILLPSSQAFAKRPPESEAPFPDQTASPVSRQSLDDCVSQIMGLWVQVVSESHSNFYIYHHHFLTETVSQSTQDEL